MRFCPHTPWFVCKFISHSIVFIYLSGDRTPKQKAKMEVTDAKILTLFDKYGKSPKFDKIQYASRDSNYFQE